MSLTVLLPKGGGPKLSSVLVMAWGAWGAVTTNADRSGADGK